MSIEKIFLFNQSFIILFLTSKTYAIHDDFKKVGCLECHFRLPFENRKPVFNDDISELCSRCHISLGHSHPVNVVPTLNIPKDMPLDIHGRLTCITCHNFHIGYFDSNGNKAFFLKGKFLLQLSQNTIKLAQILIRKY